MILLLCKVSFFKIPCQLSIGESSIGVPFLDIEIVIPLDENNKIDQDYINENSSGISITAQLFAGNDPVEENVVYRTDKDFATVKDNTITIDVSKLEDVSEIIVSKSFINAIIKWSSTDLLSANSQG